VCVYAYCVCLCVRHVGALMWSVLCDVQCVCDACARHVSTIRTRAMSVCRCACVCAMYVCDVRVRELSGCDCEPLMAWQECVAAA
jgi:hypothetical protein